MPGPFPDRALVRPGHQLDRVGQVAVPGDGAVMVAVGAELPAVMTFVVVAVAPSSSVTRSRTVTGPMAE